MAGCLAIVRTAQTSAHQAGAWTEPAHQISEQSGGPSSAPDAGVRRRIGRLVAELTSDGRYEQAELGPGQAWPGGLHELRIRPD